MEGKRTGSEKSTEKERKRAGNGGEVKYYHILGKGLPSGLVEKESVLGKGIHHQYLSSKYARNLVL